MIPRKGAAVLTILLLTCFYSYAIAGGEAAGPGAALTVSPGSPGTTAGTDQSCPTFSWSLANRAVSYRVEVYEQNTTDLLPYEYMSDIATPVRVQEIAAPALSWTPSAGECLTRGARYVWYVRGTDADGGGKWSEPRGFLVEPSALTVEQQEAVKEVVRAYLREEESKAITSQAAATVTRDAQTRPAEGRSGRAGSAASGTRQAQVTLPTQSLQLNNFGAIMDGDIYATAFHGNGSNLTGIIASNSSATSAPVGIGTSCTNYHSVTITAPTPGVILVDADVWVQLNHTTGIMDRALLYISASNTECLQDTGFYPMIAYVPPEYPTTSSQQSVHIMRRYNVTMAGDYTYSLNGVMVFGHDSSDLFSSSNMRAIFYPLIVD